MCAQEQLQRGQQVQVELQRELMLEQPESLLALVLGLQEQVWAE